MERLTISIEDQLAKQFDDFLRARGYSNRSEAIRDLIRACLSDALKMPLEMHRQLTIDYASISRMDYGKSQNNFHYMNISKQKIS